MGNFHKGLMASEDVRSLLKTGAFYDTSGKRAEVEDGALVVLGEFEDHAVYAGLKDLNVHKVKYPTADTDPVAIVDYDDRPYGEIMGVTYRDGTKTYGISCPANKNTRIRVPMKGDTFWLDSSNFATTPTVKEYAIPTASSGKFTPNASAVTDKFCVQVVEKKDTAEGTVNTRTEYFCLVTNVI